MAGKPVEPPFSDILRNFIQGINFENFSKILGFGFFVSFYLNSHIKGPPEFVRPEVYHIVEPSQDSKESVKEDMHKSLCKI